MDKCLNTYDDRDRRTDELCRRNRLQATKLTFDRLRTAGTNSAVFVLRGRQSDPIAAAQTFCLMLAKQSVKNGQEHEISHGSPERPFELRQEIPVTLSVGHRSTDTAVMSKGLFDQIESTKEDSSLAKACILINPSGYKSTLQLSHNELIVGPGSALARNGRVRLIYCRERGPAESTSMETTPLLLNVVRNALPAVHAVGYQSEETRSDGGIDQDLIDRVVKFAAIGQDENGNTEMFLSLMLGTNLPVSLTLTALGSRGLALHLRARESRKKQLVSVVGELLRRLKARSIEVVELHVTD